MGAARASRGARGRASGVTRPSRRGVAEVVGIASSSETKSDTFGRSSSVRLSEEAGSAPGRVFDLDLDFDFDFDFDFDLGCDSACGSGCGCDSERGGGLGDGTVSRSA